MPATSEGHEWSDRAGRTAAANLVAVATALQGHPLPCPRAAEPVPEGS